MVKPLLVLFFLACMNPAIAQKKNTLPFGLEYGMNMDQSEKLMNGKGRPSEYSDSKEAAEQKSELYLSFTGVNYMGATGLLSLQFSYDHLIAFEFAANGIFDYVALKNELEKLFGKEKSCGTDVLQQTICHWTLSEETPNELEVTFRIEKDRSEIDMRFVARGLQKKVRDNGPPKTKMVNNTEKKAVEKTLSITGWNEFRNKFSWKWLETPKEDANVYRYFTDDLCVMQKIANHIWTEGRLPAGSLGRNWEFGAMFSMVKDQKTDDVQHGLMLVANAEGKEMKVFFYVNPFSQTYWFGSYNATDNKWETLNSFSGNTYDITSRAIEKYDAVKDIANNHLRVRKEGAEIQLYINYTLVEKIPVSRNAALFNAFDGVGISGRNKQGYFVSKPFFSATK